jgi:hypothetical protein
MFLMSFFFKNMSENIAFLSNFNIQVNIYINQCYIYIYTGITNHYNLTSEVTF